MRKQAMCHTRIKPTFFLLLAFLLQAGVPQARAQGAGSIEQNFADPLTAVPAEPLSVAGAFYVPVYSSMAMSHGKLRADFSVTLCVHNASESRALVLKRIAYFDTTGKMVESYLKAPVALKPFATVEVFIAAIGRARRHRRQFRGRLGGRRRDRRARRGSADGRRHRRRALCVHQPGATDQADRQELTFRERLQPLQTRKYAGDNVHEFSPLRLRAAVAGRTARAGGTMDRACKIQFCRRQQRP